MTAAAADEGPPPVLVVESVEDARAWLGSEAAAQVADGHRPYTRGPDGITCRCGKVAGSWPRHLLDEVLVAMPGGGGS